MNNPEAFEEISYSRCAAFEIVRLLSEPGAEDPVSIVENFIAKVNEYSTISSETSWAFSIMYDSAMNILDVVLDIILMSEKEQYS